MNQWMNHPVNHQWLCSTNNLLPRIRIPLVNSNPHILHIRTERTLLQAILDQHSDFYPSTIAFNATDRNVHRNLRAHSINYHSVELRITSPPFSAYLLSVYIQIPIVDFVRHDLVQHRTERINVHLVCRWLSRNQLGSDTTRQSPPWRSHNGRSERSNGDVFQWIQSTSESEVSDLDVIVRDQNVLGLQISLKWLLYLQIAVNEAASVDVEQSIRQFSDDRELLAVG